MRDHLHPRLVALLCEQYPFEFAGCSSGWEVYEQVQYMLALPYGRDRTLAAAIMIANELYYDPDHLVEVHGIGRRTTARFLSLIRDLMC